MITIITVGVFLLTILFILWKPLGLNESIPTAAGAMLLILIQVVEIDDLYEIFQIVSGPSFTIICTLVMSYVLDSVGFFKWVAYNIIIKSKGSGIRLYFYIVSLCFLMTIFFNNDGSILITTPILIRIVTLLKLKPKQQIPFLLSGALIATAASAPIAVSNIANLIALEIVGLTLNSYVVMMFVPSMIGIVVIIGLLYLYYKNDIPSHIPNVKINPLHNDKELVLSHPLSDNGHEFVDWRMFKVSMIIIIFVRASFFILPLYGISIEAIAFTGALMLIAIHYAKNKSGLMGIIKRTPWHILIFAFSMYVLIFGLKNIGLIDIITQFVGPYVQQGQLAGIMTMGLLVTVLSNICNNLPAVMLGTLTLTNLDLGTHHTQLYYLASILGSDIGSLLLPTGTLATLIWMFILREQHIRVKWSYYFKVTIMVIPIGLIISLLALYFWNLFLQHFF